MKRTTILLSILFLGFLISSTLEAQTVNENGIDSKANLSGKWLGNKVKIRDGSCPVFGQPFLDMPCILEVTIDDLGFASILEYTYVKHSWTVTKIPVAEVDDNLVMTFSDIKVVQCGSESRMNQVNTRGIFRQIDQEKWVLELEGYDNMCPEWNCKFKIAYELIKEESLKKNVEKIDSNN